MIVLFDGVCNLCDNSVQFIIKHDKEAKIKFASQQSSIGLKLIAKYNLKELDSLVCINNDKVYIYSDGALEIAKKLDGLWKHLTIFHFLPKSVRDFIYKLIAKYRYRIFGKKEACLMPSLEIEERFLK